MKYNPVKYYRIGYFFAFVLTFSYVFVIIGETDLSNYISFITIFKCVFIGNELSFRLARIAFNIYEKKVFETNIEKKSIIIQVILITTYVVTEIYYINSNNIVPFILFILVYIIWTLLQNQSLKIGTKSILVGRWGYELNDIKDFKLEKRGVKINFDEHSKMLYYVLLNKKKEELKQILNVTVRKEEL